MSGSWNCFRGRQGQGRTAKRLADRVPMSGRAGEVGTGLPAQPMDALVLSPQGFRRMADLMVGDPVMAADGTPSVVTAVHPLGPLPFFQVTFSDGAQMECGEDHPWDVTPARRERGAGPKVLNLKELAAAGVRAPSGFNKWRVALARPVNVHGRRARPVDPYLLGVLIAKGSFRDDRLRLVTSSAELARSTHRHLVDGYHLEPTSGSRPAAYEILVTGARSGQRRPNPLIEDLREIGLHGIHPRHRHIPHAYQEAPVAVRLAVLQGIMDAGGTVGARTNTMGGTPSFTTDAPRLADDLAQLVRSLGGACLPRTKELAGDRTTYRLAVAIACDLVPFRLDSKARAFEPPRSGPVRTIASVRPAGTKPMQCMILDHPGHAYLTNGYVVTRAGHP